MNPIPESDSWIRPLNPILGTCLDIPGTCLDTPRTWRERGAEHGRREMAPTAARARFSSVSGFRERTRCIVVPGYPWGELKERILERIRIF